MATDSQVQTPIKGNAAVAAAAGGPLTSRAFIEQTVILKTRFGQDHYAKQFGPTLAAMFDVGVHVRSLGGEKAADKYAGYVGDQITDLNVKFEEFRAQFKKLAEDNQIEDLDIQYTDARAYPVRIMHPRAALIIKAQNEFDELVQMVDKLFVTGVFSEKQFIAAVFEMRKAIRSCFGNVIRMGKLVSRTFYANRQREALAKAAGPKTAPAEAETAAGETASAEAAPAAPADAASSEAAPAAKKGGRAKAKPAPKEAPDETPTVEVGNTSAAIQ